MRTTQLIRGAGLPEQAAQVAALSALVSRQRVGHADLAWHAAEIQAVIEADDPDLDKSWWLIADGDQVVGALELEADQTTSSPCDVELWVHPERSASELLPVGLELAYDFARRNGRDALVFWYLHAPADEQLTSPVGIGAIGRDQMAEALLAAGAKLAQVYRISALDLHSADAALPAPEGYRLVSWLGPTPPELRALVARMNEVTGTDAPAGETGYIPEQWTPERVATDEATWLASGRQMVSVIALADGDEVAGYTRVAAVAGSKMAWQWDTAVVPTHRGHGLGVVLKTNVTALLAQAHPKVNRIITFNAAENTQMLRINEALGWQPIITKGVWAVQLP